VRTAEQGSSVECPHVTGRSGRLVHECHVAQSLKIEGGVVDDQVVQRGPDGRADLVLAGVTSGPNRRGWKRAC